MLHLLIAIVKIIIWLVCKIFQSEASLYAENMALRQQLAVQNRKIKRPELTKADRIFWVLLSMFWKNWQSALLIVKAETVIKWHKQGFKLYWRRKSGIRKIGRPNVSKEVRSLIRRMSKENFTWGAPRIKDVLGLLGYDVAESTIAKYMICSSKPPSQTWKTFLKNHIGQTAAIDFFTVPTASFRIFYCFIILSHDRRKVIHFNVTAHPTAEWTIQQIREAFPYDEAPRFMLRDRDSTYSKEFSRQIKNMGIEEVISAPQSPWQNPYCERMIGSVRRECLDHVIVLNEDHLRNILKSYFEYYHNARPHQSLEGNAPNPRVIEPPSKGKVIAFPQVGGLHHLYKRAA